MAADQTITLQFDGGSRGNPGPAGLGVVLRAADGTPLFTLGRFIGRATNNVAEYRALITGLEEAVKLGVRHLEVRGDSELVIRQMRGEYRVRNPEMLKLYTQARQLVEKLPSVNFRHNLREHNALADQLANLAMDHRRDITDPTDPGESAGPSGPNAAAPAPSADASSLQTNAAVPGDLLVCSRCGCTLQVIRASTTPQGGLRRFMCQCGGVLRPPVLP